MYLTTVKATLWSKQHGLFERQTVWKIILKLFGILLTNSSNLAIYNYILYGCYKCCSLDQINITFGTFYMGTSERTQTDLLHSVFLHLHLKHIYRTGKLAVGHLQASRSVWTLYHVCACLWSRSRPASLSDG